MPRNLLLYALVSVSGASILALEILGTRVLGPFYGVSIFLWSALITITLAGLSVGYAIGGRWADRGPRMEHVGWLLGAAGIWVLLIPWMKYPLLNMTGPLGLRTAVLVASTVLFAPPLTLLGMISPYVIRLKAENLDRIGRTAGDLFAVSTVASVVSSLATGFWLIPYVGVLRLISSIGVLLILAGALAFFGARRVVLASATATVVIFAAAWVVSSGGPGSAEARGLVHVRDTPYAEIRVLDREDGRYLLIDGGVHTITGGDAQHRYIPVFDSCRYFFQGGGRMLLIGLGGGTVVQSFHAQGWEIDAVEIDPGVIDVAREYFDLKPDAARIFEMDGRLFLDDSEDRYDLILMDAFGSSAIPFHLVTVEMFEKVASRLTEDGILAMNIETRSWRDPLVGALGESLRPSFEHVWALPTAEPPNTLGNVIMLASDRKGFVFPEEELPSPQDHVMADDHWDVLQMNHAWDNRFEPPTDVAALTDDLSRVELWSEAINREARKGLREYFGDEKVW